MRFSFDKVKDLLACPRCHSGLVQDGATLVDLNPDCRLQFDIIHGIPRLLVDDARELDQQ